MAERNAVGGQGVQKELEVVNQIVAPPRVWNVASLNDAFHHARPEGPVLEAVGDDNHVIGEVIVVFGLFRKEARANRVRVVLGLVPLLNEAIKGPGDLGLATDRIVLDKTVNPLYARLVICVTLNQVCDALLRLFLLVQDGENLDTGHVFFLDPGILERQHLFVECEGLVGHGRTTVTLGAVKGVAVLKGVLVLDCLVKGALQNRRVLDVFQGILVPRPRSVRREMVGPEDADGRALDHLFAGGVLVEHADVLPALSVVEELASHVGRVPALERKVVVVGIERGG